MKLSSLNEWLTFGANFGVLIGLIFLIVELDQSNRVAVYTAESSRRSQYNEANEFFVEKSEIAAKLRSTNPVLSDSESVEAYHIALIFINNWIDAEFAYQNELVSEATFEESLTDIRVTLGRYPGLISQFEEAFDNYGTDLSTLRNMQTLVELVRENGI